MPSEYPAFWQVFDKLKSILSLFGSGWFRLVYYKWEKKIIPEIQHNKRPVPIMQEIDRSEEEGGYVLSHKQFIDA